MSTSKCSVHRPHKYISSNAVLYFSKHTLLQMYLLPNFSLESALEEVRSQRMSVKTAAQTYRVSRRALNQRLEAERGYSTTDTDEILSGSPEQAHPGGAVPQGYVVHRHSG